MRTASLHMPITGKGMHSQHGLMMRQGSMRSNDSNSNGTAAQPENRQSASRMIAKFCRKDSSTNVYVYVYINIHNREP